MRTPPPPDGLLAALPGLAGLGRTATRLHPRPGEVSASGSHVGGPLRWPVAEPWPVCAGPYLAYEQVALPQRLLDQLAAAERRRTEPHIMSDAEVRIQREITRFVGPGCVGWGSYGDGPVLGNRYVPRPHEPANPLLPVAQLRAADVPGLPCPAGTDLLQVLWCPFEHQQERCWGPAVRIFWRREADIGDLATAPPSEVGDDGYLPRPCRLHPEQVIEYPYPDELPDGLRRAARRWEKGGRDYARTVMVPGWKVGGHPNWHATGPRPTACPRCAGPAELLLVIDSLEFDGGGRERWQPIEERHVGWDDPGRLVSQNPTGVVVGRAGALRIFACPTCPGTPLVADLQ